MGEVVVAFRVLGYSYDYKDSEKNKKDVEKELSKVKTREDAEKFFQSLNGEVKFVKETEELVEASEGKVLYSFGYMNATFGYFFHDLKDECNHEEVFFDIAN